jgi:hypothetical protein
MGDLDHLARFFLLGSSFSLTRRGDLGIWSGLARFTIFGRLRNTGALIVEWVAVQIFWRANSGWVSGSRMARSSCSIGWQWDSWLRSLFCVMGGSVNLARCDTLGGYFHVARWAQLGGCTCLGALDSGLGG